MIQDTVTKSSRAALTSDRWHVVHARWNADSSNDPLFTRSIVSEHADRPAAVNAARAMRASLAGELATRPLDCQDQVFVRKPEFKSLKSAARVERRRK